MRRPTEGLGTPSDLCIPQRGHVARRGAEAVARRARHSLAVRKHRLVEMEIDLPEELAERLAKRCAAKGITVSAGLTEALEQFFAVADKAPNKKEN